MEMNDKRYHMVEKSKALVKSLVSGDKKVGMKALTDDYIQHNLDYASGKQPFLDAVEYFSNQKEKSSVDTKRVICDGDFVVLHSHYYFAGTGDFVAFDIFRYDGHHIAEHWDNIQPIVPANPSGRTQLDGETEMTDITETNNNKDLVTNFINNVLINENYDIMQDYFNGNEYIQHNPMISDGLSGLGEAIADMVKAGRKMDFNKLHMVLGEGNFVLAVTEGAIGGTPTAYYDLFRLENGKIAEHWDVISTIPDVSTWKNKNGKF